MGLDQFAYKTKIKPSQDIDFQSEIYEDENNKPEEVHYWRKHPNIHGFMEKLYRQKGGQHEFNCRTVLLTQDDIDDLANMILNGKLPETSGFFFGQSFGDEDEEKDDLDFCKKASEAIKEGYHVFYDSWW